MEDLHIEEKHEEDEAAKDASNEAPALLRPYLRNVLNADLVPGRVEEVYKLQPILRQSDNSADLSAVVSLRKAHDRNSSVLIGKSFELRLKTRHAAYEPHKLAETTKALTTLPVYLKNPFLTV